VRGFFTLCRYIGACGSSAVSCRDVAGVVPLAGGSAGCGGMLPGKGCPPFHFEPCFFCPIVSLDDSLLLLLVEVLICFFSDLCVVVWSLYDCPSVVLQSFCWNWTSAVWHEECIALCSVDSYQETLAVECSQIVVVSKDLHACWCECNRCYSCCCLFVWRAVLPV